MFRRILRVLRLIPSDQTVALVLPDVEVKGATHVAKGIERYVGGQIEIISREADRRIRGEITEMVVEGSMLTIRLGWSVRSVGAYPRPQSWYPCNELQHTMDLAAYRYSAVGSDRTALICDQIKESVMLYMPYSDGILDRSKVEG